LGVKSDDFYLTSQGSTESTSCCIDLATASTFIPQKIGDFFSEEPCYLVNHRPQGVVTVLVRKIRGAQTSTTSWRRRFMR